MSASLLEDGLRRQVLLAGLAETDEVRAVHEALEQLYRTQLVAMQLADRLANVDVASAPAVALKDPGMRRHP